MSCRITVRLSSSARRTLDDVAQRTQRPLVWLLAEAITDASQALALDQAALDPYVTPPAAGDTARTTIVASAATESVLSTLQRITGYKPAVIARAAWLRWLAIYSENDLVAFGGGVRPGRETA